MIYSELEYSDAVAAARQRQQGIGTVHAEHDPRREQIVIDALHQCLGLERWTQAMRDRRHAREEVTS